MALLNISELYFSYQRGYSIFSDLNLSFHEGELVGLVGPNGSGKSTLIKLCFDLLEAGSGDITINGFPHDSAQARKSSIYLPSDDYLPEFLTGAEYLSTVFDLYAVQLPSAERLAECFSELGMNGRQNSLIEDYSHGMRKKLLLMSAQLLERPLTVIDETLNGVDLDAQRLLRRQLLQLKERGLSVLLCSHDFSLLESLASRVLVLNRGELVKELRVPELGSLGIRLQDAVDEVLFGNEI